MRCITTVLRHPYPDMSERSVAQPVSAKPKPARPFRRLAVARKAAYSPADSQHPATRFTSSTPGRGGSRKWEPTCSAALRRTTTQSDSSRRSRAPGSTQSDGGRRPEAPWNSLTRKRSLVQIQYGPPRFCRSKPVLTAQRLLLHDTASQSASHCSSACLCSGYGSPELG